MKIKHGLFLWLHNLISISHTVTQAIPLNSEPAHIKDNFGEM